MRERGDDLRQRCEAVASQLLQYVEVEGGYFCDPDTALDILIAFARREQAQGMRDAAKYIRDLARSDAYQRHT